MSYALITGASSGIGEAFARNFAAKKKPLLLIGRNEGKLRSLAEELHNKEGIDVRILAIDLARSKELPFLPSKLQQMGITVDVLINNAGFGKYGKDMDISYEDDLNMVNLNCRALLALTKLFLPDMLRAKKGAIINIASILGFFPLPKMATYSATKSFVVSYTEALAKEYKDSGVKFLCSCPGFVDTPFHERAGSKRFDSINYETTERIVEETLAALKSNKTMAIVGKQKFWDKIALSILPRWLFIELMS
ncbi:MAG: SDR family oxidoreductase [Patescibacteria group bacterium]|nr:SDR family oxidoreductase [Patescibacteria group bacterium]